MSNLLANNKKPLTKSDSSNYVNIKTNKKITNLNNSKFTYYKLADHYICGEDSEIDIFIA